MEQRNAEISLLLAMYPDQISWTDTSQELKYVSGGSTTLVLRLTPTYPEDHPELILVRGPAKEDLREDFKNILLQREIPVGEEICDAIIQAFEDHLASKLSRAELDTRPLAEESGVPSSLRTCKVVVCWLHHLLATSKRKLALNPSVDASSIRGLTKPGYPGILIFAGPVVSVDAHVSELKAQRWQAFQVRLEEEFQNEDSNTLWRFKHGEDIIEFESMAEVVEDLENGAEQQKFLAAVGIK